MSETANSIVAPLDRTEKAQALKSTFLKTEEFEKVYQRLVGKILPEDSFLQNSFLEYGGKELAPKWMESFKDSANYAGLLMDRGDGKLQVREMGRSSAKDGEVASVEAEIKSSSKIETPLDRLTALASAPVIAAKTDYQFLIEILAADMSKDEQDAVWTLIQYLKKKEAGQSGTSEE